MGGTQKVPRRSRTGTGLKAKGVFVLGKGGVGVPSATLTAKLLYAYWVSRVGFPSI